MADLAHNIHRLMARHGLTQAALAQRSDLDERTIKGLLRGTNTKPHARTLFKLARGLGVSVDELFHDGAMVRGRKFDRQTNPVVDEVVLRHPEEFQSWTPEEFDELYSRFGTGGPLTAEGVLQVAAQMRQRREVHRQVDVLLETHEAELLKSLVNVLYQRVTLTAGGGPSAMGEGPLPPPSAPPA